MYVKIIIKKSNESNRAEIAQSNLIRQATCNCLFVAQNAANKVNCRVEKNTPMYCKILTFPAEVKAEEIADVKNNYCW